MVSRPKKFFFKNLNMITDYIFIFLRGGDAETSGLVFGLRVGVGGTGACPSTYLTIYQ